MRLFAAGNNDVLPFVIAVAMLHGIVDSFSQADQDIRIEIRINVEPVDELLNKMFYFAYAAWM